MPPSEALLKALALLQGGDHQAAQAQLRRIIQREPRNADAFHLLAAALDQAGQPGPAVFFAQRSVELAPGNSGFLTLLACTLAAQEQWDKAVAAAERAVQADASNAAAHNALGAALLKLDKLVESLSPLQQANQLVPQCADFEFNLGRALLLTGEIEQGIALLSQSTSHDPGNARYASFFASALNYSEVFTPLQVRVHERAAALIQSAAGPFSTYSPSDTSPDRQLRIGLLSPDFHTHSVSFFVEPLLEHRDKDNHFIACYHTAPRVDETTLRLRTRADLWRDVHALGDREAAERIKTDKIDILIDLCGHTSGTRLGIMALRPAPIGATYLGYPATTGLTTVDWRIVDSITDPPGNEPHCTEQLLRLDPCFICYRPPEAAPLPGPPREGDIVFGSFNNALKLSDTAISLWCRVIKAIPASRMLLKAGRLEVPQIASRLRDRFAAHGVDPARLILDSNKPTQAEHMAAYHRVDIALDTYPYNGTTTTCDSLHMGVPVVTLAGASHVSRVSASLLTAVGLTDLIAHSPDEFVTVATRLASDRPRLAQLHQSLRERLTNSPLCDAQAFALRFDQALRTMWMEYLARRP